jgi:UDP-glucose:glycoprotein glucosyltransferase
MTPATASDPGVGRLSLAQNAYERLQAASPKDTLPFDQVIGTSSLSEELQKVSSYQNRLLATKSESASGHMFVNGKYYPFASVRENDRSLLTRQHWTNLVQSELTNQVAFLQEQLQSGHPVNDVANFFYDLPGVPKRRSKIIVPTTGEHAMKSVNLLELFASESYKRMFNTFLYPSKSLCQPKDKIDRVDDPAQATPVSMWVIGDLDSADGFRVVKDALQHLQSEDCTSRLGFIHVPTSEARISTGHSASTVLHQLVSMSGLRTVTAEEIWDLLEHINEDEASFKKRADGPQKPLDHLRHKGIQSLALKGWGMDQESQNPYSTWEQAGSEIARKLGIDASKPHLMVNGRVSHARRIDAND